MRRFLRLQRIHRHSPTRNAPHTHARTHNWDVTRWFLRMMAMDASPADTRGGRNGVGSKFVNIIFRVAPFAIASDRLWSGGGLLCWRAVNNREAGANFDRTELTPFVFCFIPFDIFRRLWCHFRTFSHHFLN